jgi:hypothetical protein
MPRSSRRHTLVIYTLTIDRWWKKLLAIGVFLLLIAGGLGYLPMRFPNMGFLWIEDWRLWMIAAAGAIATLFSLFLFITRKKAYVQAFPNHFRVVTPFLRLNISYRRVRRSYTSEMQQVFPSNKISRVHREMVRSLAKRNVILVEMNRLPISRSAARMFLSPLFFPDQTAKLCLLVPDWIAFSTELDSFFNSWQNDQRQSPGQPQRSFTQPRR